MVNRGTFSLLLACVIGGCAPAAPRSVLEAPKLVSSSVVVIRNRPFSVDVVSGEWEDPPGSGKRTVDVGLSVHGDDRRISLAATRGPFEPRVRGDDIEFGGHTFTITSVPGEYRSDGRPVSLQAGPWLHAFLDGAYKFSEPSR